MNELTIAVIIAQQPSRTTCHAHLFLMPLHLLTSGETIPIINNNIPNIVPNMIPISISYAALFIHSIDFLYQFHRNKNTGYRFKITEQPSLNLNQCSQFSEWLTQQCQEQLMLRQAEYK